MRSAAAALVLLLGGCAGCLTAAFSDPPVPPRPAAGQMVTQIWPTPLVRVQWALMEFCVGRVVPIETWAFYRVWAHAWPEPGIGLVVGYADQATRSIYLGSDARNDVPIIRHEILHALGISWHTDVFAFCDASPSEMATFVPR